MQELTQIENEIVAHAQAMMQRGIRDYTQATDQGASSTAEEQKLYHKLLRHALIGLLEAELGVS